MKNKYLLIAGASLMVSLCAVFGFTNKPESGGILTMRTIESTVVTGEHSISIIYENGKVEKIELAKLSGRDHSQNLLLINETLNKLQSSGYRLISSAACGDGFSSFSTTYTFEKE